jgi:hypothetical protein
MSPRLKNRIALLLSFMVLLSQSGCTDALWEDKNMGGLCQPTHDPGLHLYESEHAEDFLVVYNESYRHRHQMAIHRQAYWLDRNALRTANDRRPVFANPAPTNGLRSIPVYYSQVDLNSNQSYVAICDTNTQVFTLFSAGEYRGAYKLPVYTNRRGTMEKAALTPFAVAVDLTIIGGIVVYFAGYWYAEGYCNGYDPATAPSYAR